MQRIKELDGWRGVSILLVIGGHLIAFRYFELFKDMPHVLELGAWMSDLGVHIFFCISGFVITRILLDQELARGSISLRWFYVRRAFKILPVLWVYLAVVALLSAQGAVILDADSLIWASLFACNTGLECGWLVVHTWSLAVEEQFYLLFPLLLWLTKRSLRAYVFAAMLGCFLVIALLKYYLRIGNWIDNGAAFSCISAGVLMALGEKPLRSIVARCPHPSLVAVLILLILLQAPHRLTTILAYQLFDPLLIGAMLLLTTGGQAGRSVLNSRPLQIVGTVSYSLYVWQQLFTGKSFLYAPESVVVRSMIALVVVTACCYWFVERPMTALGRGISARTKAWPARKPDINILRSE